MTGPDGGLVIDTGVGVRNGTRLLARARDLAERGLILTITHSHRGKLRRRLGSRRSNESHEEPPGMAPSCRICERTSTTPQVSAILPSAKRKTKISLYATDLPVGGRPMYSP